tara:strand:+ start:166 stop:579 length:414 start_codon:yes stop_codon:yes gene_type:complete
MKICIVLSNFYPKISKKLLSGAVAELKKNKVTNYKIIHVPGTFEIPTVVSNYIKNFFGFIVLGCIIKGETPHFDYLSKSVTQAILNLSIQSKKPITNGIITCFNKKQAVLRSDPRKKNKGGEAAKALISILKILKND